MVYDAIQASLEAHKDQLRKLDFDAYVAHPLEVAIILAQNGADEDVISAGILHDTVEDTSITLEDLKMRFGDRIAEIVAGCTEPPQNISWHDRKRWAIQRVTHEASYDERLVICADKLSNMRSIARNYRLHGDKVWQGFHAPYEWQKWYYIEMLSAFNDLSHLPMHTELTNLIHEVFI